MTSSHLLLLAVVFLPQQLARQGPVWAHQQSCECRVQRRLVASIGNSRGYHLSGYPPSVAIDRHGRFYLIDGRSGGVVLLDSAGHLVREIGGRGRGAGQFTDAAVVRRGPGDSIHILDAALSRWSILSPEGLFVRSTALTSAGSPSDFLVLKEGEALINARFNDRDNIGQPLALLRSDGSAAAYFGSSTAYVEPQTVAHLVRRLGYGARGYWVASPFTDELQLIDRAGHVLQTAPPRQWFVALEDSAKPRTMFNSLTPSMQVQAVWEDTTGLVWTATLIPAADWHPPEIPDPRRPLTQLPTVDRPYATVIEVLDVSARMVVATDTLPGMAVYNVDTGVLALYRETPHSHIPVLEIWQLSLVDVRVPRPR